MEVDFCLYFGQLFNINWISIEVIIIIRNIGMKSNNMMLPNYVKFMKPSATCQACFSDQQLHKDCIITCQICRSSVHQTHYGSQLMYPPEPWRCERCRYFLQNGTEQIIKCEFCPDLRGIMKRFAFDDKKIWVHIECASWGYPLIFFATPRREGLRHQKPRNQFNYFWVEDFDQNNYPCEVCKEKSGFRLKCRYYSCKRSYHVTCARPLGIVRDLQSFRIDSTNFYFPVYCKEHIQLKIADYSLRAKQMKQRQNLQKSNHFAKISLLLQQQLKNLQQSIAKCKIEEQMIQKLTIQTQKNNQANANLQFPDITNSFHSQDSELFLDFLEENLVKQELQAKIKQKSAILMEVNPVHQQKDPQIQIQQNQVQIIPEKSLKQEGIMQHQVPQNRPIHKLKMKRKFQKKQDKRRNSKTKKSKLIVKNNRSGGQPKPKRKLNSNPSQNFNENSPKKQFQEENIQFFDQISCKENQRLLERIGNQSSDQDLFGGIQPPHIQELSNHFGNESNGNVSHEELYSDYGNERNSGRRYNKRQKAIFEEEQPDEKYDDEEYEPSQEQEEEQESIEAIPIKSLKNLSEFRDLQLQLDKPPSNYEDQNIMQDKHKNYSYNEPAEELSNKQKQEEQIYYSDNEESINHGQQNNNDNISPQKKEKSQEKNCMRIQRHENQGQSQYSQKDKVGSNEKYINDFQ